MCESEKSVLFTVAISAFTHGTEGNGVQWNAVHSIQIDCWLQGNQII